METNNPGEPSRFGKIWIVLLVAGIGLVLLIAISETKARREFWRQRAVDETEFSKRRLQGPEAPAMLPKAPALPSAPQTPTEVVSNKVSQFSRSRREMTYAFGAKYNVSVPPEVQEFYEAVEAGDWERSKLLFDKLWKMKDSDDPVGNDLKRLSAPILETFGVFEQAQLWPPEKLLEYGNAVLGALKPDMVYIGGTDAGRFIPTLLNETADPAERRIVITQNALADGIYMDYFDFQYGDQLKAPSHEQSEAAFQSYVAEAQKRFEHDRDFPDEPKQVRSGENLEMKDGKFSVSGAQAVMDINERILSAFMKANPDLHFAMEESFPFKSVYSSASPLGPIFEINAAEGEKALDANSASVALKYWQNAANSLASDPVASKSEEAQKAYSHMAKAQAMFFKERGFNSEAEMAYGIARQIYPGNIEAAVGLSDLYIRQGRAADGEKALADFERQFPEQQKQLANWRLHHSLLWPNAAKP